MFLLSKLLRLEDIVIDSTLLQEIKCYFISRNSNNTADESIKTELRAITMNDLVKAVERSLSAVKFNSQDINTVMSITSRSSC